MIFDIFTLEVIIKWLFSLCAFIFMKISESGVNPEHPCHIWLTNLGTMSRDLSTVVRPEMGLKSKCT